MGNLPSLQRGKEAMSDVPEGYKMSAVGVIPEEWEVKSLDNIGSFKKGKNIPKKDLTLEGVPCVLYGEIYTKYNFTSKKLSSFIPLAIAQQSTSINKGDILFAGSGETADEIGKCFTYLGDEKACAGGDINILSPFNNDSTFLGYLLNSPQVNKQKSNLGQGSSVVHIYSSSLKTILIPLPPLPEQQAIASALSDVDALITALERLITKKRNIKQGAMQQLLTGEKRLPGFGGAWEVKNIGDFASATAGGTPSTSVPEYWNGDIRWMSSGELNLKKVYEVEGRITEIGLKNSSTTIVPPKCVLIGLAGQGKTRGTAAINYMELCTNQSIAAIFPNDSFIPEYLFYNLYLRYNELRNLSTGDSGRGGLNLKIIKGIPIPFPTKAEQTAIAQIWADEKTFIQPVILIPFLFLFVTPSAIDNG